MLRLREDFTLGMMISVVILGVVCPSALGREVKLMICPQKAPAEAGKYTLLPSPASLTDGDAVPWYEKAIQALPDKAGDAQVRQWLKLPLDRLPGDQVEETLTGYVESFKCVAQAVKCRDCNWPAWKPGMQVANTDEYRRLAFAIRLWARFELSNGQYDGAILALRTGFGMARQLAQAPTVVQLLTGIAAGAFMSRGVEELAQMPDAPNLGPALAGLPRPFVDVEKVIASEKEAASSSGLLGRLGAKQAAKVTDPAYNATRALAKRFDRDLAALQCIEAIRAHAGSHDGQLPQTVAEITEVPVPEDPLNGAPFRYTRTGATATLESPAPASSDKREELRYEIAVKN